MRGQKQSAINIKDGIFTAVLVALVFLISLDQVRVGRKLLVFEHLNDEMAFLGVLLFVLTLFLAYREGKNGRDRRPLIRTASPWI